MIMVMTVAFPWSEAVLVTGFGQERSESDSGSNRIPLTAVLRMDKRMQGRNRETS